MSVLTVSAPTFDRACPRPAESTTRRVGSAPVRQRPGEARPSRGSGRARGPLTRPTTGVAPPRLRPAGSVGARGCVAEPAPLRLTDRGIAVIIVAGLMLVVASLVVIGATAARVTSENYRPTVQRDATQVGAVQSDGTVSLGH